MPTTVLDQQPRNGTIISGSATCPAADAINPETSQPYGVVIFDTTLADADILDPDSHCLLTPQASTNGVDWVSAADPFQWNGGPLDKKGNPNTKRPGLGFTFADIGGVRPTAFRCILDTQGTTLNLGATVAFQ